MLTVRCHFHPRYRAVAKPGSGCETCKLLYALTRQHIQDQKELLAKLGSKLTAAVGNDAWEEALTSLETGKKSNLGVRCRHHRYQATRRPGWDCDACWLLFVLKYQAHEDGERRLGPFNPYRYVIDFVDLKKACTHISVTG